MEDDYYNLSEHDSREIKYVVRTLLIILIVSLANNHVVSFFNKYVVSWLLGFVYKPELSLTETILTFCIFFYTLYLISGHLGRTRYKVRYYFILLLATTLLLYIRERLYGNNYEFTNILNDKDSEGIKLLDFPSALLAITIAVLIINRLRETKLERSADLMNDLPLKETAQDEFWRKRVYENLVNQIVSINYSEYRSFNIAIVNKWGEGKTSFLNFIEDELRKDQTTIIVKFNAWYSSYSENITNDFFKTFDDALSKHIYTGSLIRRYANNLTQINSVYNPSKYLPQHWVNQESNQEYFEKIESLLRHLDRRIFVIIDDLDRLNNMEVFNVLRVIRNSANFPFVIFLVPFDKEYVVHALTENKIFDPVQYVKKIFDVELSLTPIYKEYLQPILISILTEFIKTRLAHAPIDDTKELEKQVQNMFSNLGSTKYSAINIGMFKFLKSKRDIIRFTNSLKLSLKHNYSKLYLPDLVLLELIKYQDNAIYRRLFEDTEYLNTYDGVERKILKLFKPEDELTDDQIINGINNFDILKDMNIDMLPLVKALFEVPQSTDYNANLSISYEFNYLNYIQYDVSGISYDDLKDLIGGQ